METLIPRDWNRSQRSTRYKYVPVCLSRPVISNKSTPVIIKAYCRLCMLLLYLTGKIATRMFLRGWFRCWVAGNIWPGIHYKIMSMMFDVATTNIKTSRNKSSSSNISIWFNNFTASGPCFNMNWRCIICYWPNCQWLRFMWSLCGFHTINGLDDIKTFVKIHQTHIIMM